MPQLIIFIIIVMAIGAILVLSAIVDVPPDNAMVVERRRRFNRILAPGIHLVWPIFENLHEFTFEGAPRLMISTAPQTLKLASLSLLCLDGKQLQAGVELTFQVREPQLAAYHVVDPPRQLRESAIERLQQCAAERDGDQVFEEEGEFTRLFTEIFPRQWREAGIEVKEVRFTKLEPV